MARIDNLGDYNIVRDALHERGGDAAKLFEDIGNAAVAEKRPEILKEGARYATIAIFAFELLAFGVYKAYGFVKQVRKDRELVSGRDKLKTELERLNTSFNDAIKEGGNDYEEER